MNPDFSKVEQAAKTLHTSLREDEGYPDLSEQFKSQTIKGSHHYFNEPYKSTFGSMIEEKQFLPFPNEILRLYKTAQCATFMGILPEIHRVWLTIDGKLFLWNYYNPSDCIEYNLASEVIVSVTLTTPKVGIFAKEVQYLLIVATPIEVVILAIFPGEVPVIVNGLASTVKSVLKATNHIDDDPFKTIHLVPTSYRLPSDDITMLKMVGSQTGRIFMVGNDASLYELDYINVESAWSTVIGGEPQRKCRKLSHSTWQWKLSHFLPPFLRVFASQEDEFADLVVDNARNLLYTVTLHGILNLFWLGSNGRESHAVVTDVSILEQARRQLTMTGKSLDSSATVVSLTVTSPLESRNVHAILVLSNGFRLYLAVHGRSFGFMSPPFTGQTEPNDITVAFVRAPPPESCVDGTADQPQAPSFSHAKQLDVTTSLSSPGISMYGIKRGDRSELLCLTEDLLNHTGGILPVTSTIGITFSPASSIATMTSTVCLKEAVNLISLGTLNESRIHAIAESCPEISIDLYTLMRELYAFSKTPEGVEKESTHHTLESYADLMKKNRSKSSFWTLLTDPDSLAHGDGIAPAMPLTTSATSLPMASSSSSIGFNPADINTLVVLGELAWQHMPLRAMTTQRQFLVLTSNGLHVLRKVRPTDILARLLRTVDETADDRVRSFFMAYGREQSAVMCLALACGLPADANGLWTPPGQEPSSSAMESGVSESVRVRALSMLLKLGVGPSMSALSAGGLLLQNERAALTANQPLFTGSTVHNALFTLAGRILRPVWYRPIMVNDQLAPHWTENLINELKMSLEALRTTVSAELTALKGTSSMSSSGTAEEKRLRLLAREEEERSVTRLYMLLSRSLHALAVLSTLLSVRQLDSQLMQRLTAYNFRAIVVSPLAAEAIQKDVRLVVEDLADEKQRHEEADLLMERLASQAFHYFSRGHLCEYRAKQVFACKLASPGSVSWTMIGSSRYLGGGEALRDSVVALAEPLDERAVQAVIDWFLQAAPYWNTVESVEGKRSSLWQACLRLAKLGRRGREAIVTLCFRVAANFETRSTTLTSETSRVVTLISAASGGSSGATSASSEENLYHMSGVVMEADKAAACRQSCYRCLVDHIIAISHTALETAVVMIRLAVAAAQSPVASATTPLGGCQDSSLSTTTAVSATASSNTGNELFHSVLHHCLLADAPDLLKRVDSPQVVAFLATARPMLLRDYYLYDAAASTANGRGRPPDFVKAALLMRRLALDGTSPLEISSRVEYLTAAVEFARKARADHSTGYASTTRSVVHAYATGLNSNAGSNAGGVLGGRHNVNGEVNLTELTDRLAVAQFQKMVHQRLVDLLATVNSSPVARPIYLVAGWKDSLSAIVARLDGELLTERALYNDVCRPFQQWDLCLRLLFVTQTDDVDTIRRLWASLIYRHVPRRATTAVVTQTLESKRAKSCFVDDFVDESAGTFENSTPWLSNLRASIADVAAALRVDTALPKQFPLAEIVEELEELVGLLAAATDANISTASATEWACEWVSETLATCVRRPEAMVEAYLSLVHRQLAAPCDAAARKRQLQLLASATRTLRNWLTAPPSLSTTTPTVLASLSFAENTSAVHLARSGVLRSWLKLIRDRLCQLGTTTFGGDGRWDILLLNVAENVDSCERRLVELTQSSIAR